MQRGIFEGHWFVLAECGLVDGLGGASYKRVWESVRDFHWARRATGADQLLSTWMVVEANRNATGREGIYG